MLSLLLTWALDWDLHIGVLSSGSGATPVVGHSHVRLQLVHASQAQRSHLLGFQERTLRGYAEAQAFPRPQEELLKDRNAELEAELARLRVSALTTSQNPQPPIQPLLAPPQSTTLRFTRTVWHRVRTIVDKQIPQLMFSLTDDGRVWVFAWRKNRGFW